MRVLLTGATGFLGSHLARAFLARGDAVHAVRRSTSSLARLTGVANRMHWHDALISAGEAMLLARPGVIVHAATHYGRGGGTDTDVARVNSDWPVALLGAAPAGVVFVNVDTSLPPALSAYARTKRHFAEHARGAAENGRARVLNLNLESVYGPGDDPAKFQMVLIAALLRGDPVFPLTAGEQSRDYIFIADAVEATLRLVDHAAASGEPYLAAGVGRAEAVTIRRFAETARAVAGSATRLEFGALPYRAGELMEARADITLLRALGWAGGRSLEAGLRETIERERGGA